VRACVVVSVSMSGLRSQEISVLFPSTVLSSTLMTGSNCFGLIEGVFYLLENCQQEQVLSMLSTDKTSPVSTPSLLFKSAPFETVTESQKPSRVTFAAVIVPNGRYSRNVRRSVKISHM